MKHTIIMLLLAVFTAPPAFPLLPSRERERDELAPYTTYYTTDKGITQPKRLKMGQIEKIRKSGYTR